MNPQAQNFTRLEQAVLNAVCEMHPSDRATLKAQLATAVLLKRENTGAGFFTYFDVDRSVGFVAGQRLRDGPESVKIKGLQYGMGFILWLKECYANCLEGYCLAGESTTHLALDTLDFELGPSG